MAAELFMRVNEVAEVMDVSESYAIRLSDGSIKS